jgi:hypothetical protein
MWEKVTVSLNFPGQLVTQISVSNINVCKLDDRCSNPSRQLGFSLRHHIQFRSAASAVSFPISTECSLLGVKRPKREAGHISQYKSCVKNASSFIFMPLRAS